MGFFNKCDLLSEAEAIRLVKLHKPEIRWISFACGATSLSNISTI